LLGIDLGTSSVKVVLTTIDGTVAGQAAAEYGIDRPAPDRAEQHPDAWWRGIVDATAAALGEAAREAPGHAAPAARIIAIGLSGQMHGLVLLSGAASNRRSVALTRLAAEGVHHGRHVTGVDPHLVGHFAFAIERTNWPAGACQITKLTQRKQDCLFDSQVVAGNLNDPVVNDVASGLS
jgi:hypothetical protein